MSLVARAFDFFFSFAYHVSNWDSHMSTFGSCSILGDGFGWLPAPFSQFRLLMDLMKENMNSLGQRNYVQFFFCFLMEGKNI